MEYARWLAEADGDIWTTSKILAGIRKYNREDCESTWRLAEWLRERQRNAQIGYVAPAARPVDDEPIPARWQPAEDLAASLRMRIPTNLGNGSGLTWARISAQVPPESAPKCCRNRCPSRGGIRSLRTQAEKSSGPMDRKVSELLGQVVTFHRRESILQSPPHSPPRPSWTRVQFRIGIGTLRGFWGDNLFRDSPRSARNASARCFGACFESWRWS